MAVEGVGAGRLACGKAVVNVPPVVRADVLGRQAERFDLVDRLQGALDSGPAGQAQQRLTAWRHAGHSGVRRAGGAGAQDVDPRDDGAVVAGGPANEREDALRREREDAPPPIEYLLVGVPAEADPVLDLALKVNERDVGGGAHGRSPSSLGNSRSRSVRSISATV